MYGEGTITDHHLSLLGQKVSLRRVWDGFIIEKNISKLSSNPNVALSDYYDRNKDSF